MKELVAAAWLVVVACGGRSASERPSGPRTQITYSIDLDAVMDDRATALRQDIEEALADRMLRAVVRIPRVPVGAVTVVPEDPATKHRIDELLAKSYAELERRDCEPQDGPAAICVRIAADHVGAIKEAALGNAAKTIRRRLDFLKVSSARVDKKGDQIVVSFTTTSDEQGAAIRKVIARTGNLELKVVDNGAEYMRRLFAHVGADGPNHDPTEPGARRAEIRAEVDQWHTDDGAMHFDHYLVAHDRTEQVSREEARRLGCGPATVDDTVTCTVSGRAAIDRYLQELARIDPTFLVPDDREIGYELVLPDSSAKDQRPAWRTYFLERTARMTGAAISNVSGTLDPYTNRPIVLLDFNRAGARTFERLTSEIVGKKLATILDGTIKSAPIILGTIRGGRASITMGGSDVARQVAERDELVTIFKAGSLPAPLYEESAFTIGP